MNDFFGVGNRYSDFVTVRTCFVVIFSCSFSVTKEHTQCERNHRKRGSGWTFSAFRSEHRERNLLWSHDGGSSSTFSSSLTEPDSLLSSFLFSPVAVAPMDGSKPGFSWWKPGKLIRWAIFGKVWVQMIESSLGILVCWSALCFLPPMIHFLPTV